MTGERLAVAVDCRFWHLGAPPYWFRSAMDGGTVVVWRESGKSFATFGYLEDDKHEHAVILENWGADPWRLLQAFAVENEGRPSWRESAITRRADGIAVEDEW